MAKALNDPGPLEFEAKIYRNGDVNNSSAFVEFLYDLKENFGIGNLVPVRATFDERVQYKGSLAKMGGLRAVLLLRKDVRAELGKQPGEMVHVRVVLDDTLRELVVGEDIKQALKQAGFLDIFEKLAFSHRREYMRWIDAAKKPETRVNRIQKMCEMLTAGKKMPR